MCIAATWQCVLANRSSQEPTEPTTRPLPPRAVSTSLQCHRESHLDGLLHLRTVQPAGRSIGGNAGEKREEGNINNRRREVGKKSLHATLWSYHQEPCWCHDLFMSHILFLASFFLFRNLLISLDPGHSKGLQVPRLPRYTRSARRRTTTQR